MLKPYRLPTSQPSHPIYTSLQASMIHSTVVMAVRIWVWCSTLLMIYMPSRYVRRIYRERTVGSAPLVPIIFVLANSHVWMLYGYLGHTWFPSFPVFLIGDVVSLGYLYIYWRFSDPQDRVTQQIGLLFAWLTVPTLYVSAATLGFTGQSRHDIWKTHGLCFCDVTVMTLHMLFLQDLIHAYKQQSAAKLAPRSLALSTFNTLGWFTFGHVTSNWIIWWPQVFVIALHVAAWTMYGVFTYQKRPEIHFEEARDGMFVTLSPQFDTTRKEEQF